MIGGGAGLDFDFVAKEVEEAALGDVVVVVGVSMERLQKGNIYMQDATWPQYTQDLGGALKGVFYMFEQGDGDNGVESVVFEGEFFRSPADIGCGVICNIAIDNIGVIILL